MSKASFLCPFVNVTNGQTAQSESRAPARKNAHKELAFTMQPQQMDNWCWAAVTASICTYYATQDGTTPKSQCDVVREIFKKDCPNCPQPPQPPTNCNYNRTNNLDDSLDKYHHLNGPIKTGALDFQILVQEIDKSRPVCCHIDLKPGGHYVAIIGYDNITQDVVVRDPAVDKKREGNIPYKDFLDSALGKWDETYLTKPLRDI